HDQRRIAVSAPRPSAGNQGGGVSSRWEATGLSRRGRHRENLGGTGVAGVARPDQVTNDSNTKGAGRASPPSERPAPPGSPRRSVCAPGAMALPSDRRPLPRRPRGGDRPTNISVIHESPVEARSPRHRGEADVRQVLQKGAVYVEP